MVESNNNLPTEFLRAVGRKVGILQWTRESSRRVMGNPSLVESLEQLKKFVQLAALRYKVRLGIVLTHKDLANGLDAELLSKLLVDTFCSIWHYKRVSTDETVSNRAICRHIAQCPSCSDQLVADMELLIRMMTCDYRPFYSHLIRADIVEVNLSYEMSSLCKGLASDDQEEVEDGFRMLCRNSQDMKKIFADEPGE